MQSAEIGKLAEALSKAQAEIEGAKKNAENPFFHSSYADLESVWGACREPLTKNGLAVIQLPDMKSDKVVLTTTILHSSGEWISGDYPINPMKPDPQALKSAITYARRSALAAAVGIPEVDDDAEATMNRPMGKSVETESASAKKPTEAQLNRLLAIAKSARWPEQELRDYVKMTFGKTTRTDLNLEEYNKVCDWVTKHPYPVDQSKKLN